MDPQEGIVNLDYNYLFGTLQPNNSMFQTYWKRFYEGINRANDVIENIGRVPDMSDATKAKRIAECKFLRAYHYYRLNALWRGVPITTGTWLRTSIAWAARRRRRSGDLS